MKPDSLPNDPVRAGRVPRGGVSTALTVVVILLLLAALPLLFLLRADHYGIASESNAPPFQLQDAAGNTLTLADFRGRYLFLMFGYLHCPDVCHTQALTFQEVALLLGEQTKDVVFAYVAIDPARDSPEAVSQYFDDRGDNFVSLHGPDERAMQSLAAAYRVFFARRGGLLDRDAEIDHTALFFLVDQRGRLRYTYAASQNDSRRIVEDLQRLDRGASIIHSGFVEGETS